MAFACNASPVERSPKPEAGPRLDRLIDRPRLTGDRSTAIGGTISMVIAPAGSGKSVLLSQLAPPTSTCWLELRPSHDDATVLARELVESIRSVHPELDSSTSRLAFDGGRRLGEPFLHALASELDALSTLVTVVLDDLHNLSNRQVMDELGEVLERIPNNVRVLIGSRWDPPLGLGRLRLDGRVSELRAGDLAFEPDEARQLLEQAAGRAVSERQAGALTERTEGWAAGLKLAALSMQSTDELDSFIEAFTGTDRLVADYLTGAVLRSLDPDLQRFLVRTAILDDLTPELCDVVVGEDNAPTMLRTIESRGLFVVDDGMPGRPPRYHHLFADLLRYQLLADDPSVERACRRRAASWLLDHADIAGAVRQLVAAGARAEAFDILAAEGHRLFQRGESRTLMTLLEAIGEPAGRSPATVRINLMAAQVGADEYEAGAETHRLLSTMQLTAGERVAGDTLGSLLVHGDLALTEAARRAAQATSSLAEVDGTTVVDFLGAGGDKSCEIMAKYAAGYADLLADRPADAATVLEPLLESPAMRYQVWRINTAGTLALALALVGELEAASSHAMRAIEIAGELDVLHHQAATTTHFGLVVIALDRVDSVSAAEHLRNAESCVARSRRPFSNHMLQILDARCVAATDGPAAALLRLEPMGRAGTRPLIASLRRALEIQLLLQVGQLERAEALVRAGAVGRPGRVDVCLARGDLGGAREVMESWTPPDGSTRARVERGIRLALVEQAEGHQGPAGTLMAEAATEAEVELLVSPFVEIPQALTLLRTATPRQTSSRLRARVDDVAAGHRVGPRIRGPLVDPLTERELAVVSYLPTRLSNQEIAEALYISVNTLKTHLRNTYRKLDVGDRDAAVECASRLGLL
jgi:LuxR family maltose regulon positive regulatory protein